MYTGCCQPFVTSVNTNYIKVDLWKNSRTIIKNCDFAVEPITTANSSHIQQKLFAFLKTYFRAHNEFLAAEMT